MTSFINSLNSENQIFLNSLKKRAAKLQQGLKKGAKLDEEGLKGFKPYSQIAQNLKSLKNLLEETKCCPNAKIEKLQSLITKIEQGEFDMQALHRVLYQLRSQIKALPQAQKTMLDNLIQQGQNKKLKEALIYYQQSLSQQDRTSKAEWKIIKQRYLIDDQNKEIQHIAQHLFEEGYLSKGMSLETLIIKTADFVKEKIKYQKEVSSSGQNKDEWQSIEESLQKGSGDCEDLAIFHLSLLQHVFKKYKGLSKEEVYSQLGLEAGYVQQTEGREGHVLISFQREGKQYYIDTTQEKVLFEQKESSFQKAIFFNQRNYQKFQTLEDNYNAQSGFNHLVDSLSGSNQLRAQRSNNFFDKFLYEYDLGTELVTEPDFNDMKDNSSITIDQLAYYIGNDLEQHVFNTDWEEFFDMPKLRATGESSFQYLYQEVSAHDYISFVNSIQPEDDTQEDTEETTTSLEEIDALSNQISVLQNERDDLLTAGTDYVNQFKAEFLRRMDEITGFEFEESNTPVPHLKIVVQGHTITLNKLTDFEDLSLASSSASLPSGTTEAVSQEEASPLESILNTWRDELFGSNGFFERLRSNSTLNQTEIASFQAYIDSILGQNDSGGLSETIYRYNEKNLEIANARAEFDLLLNNYPQSNPYKKDEEVVDRYYTAGGAIDLSNFENKIQAMYTTAGFRSNTSVDALKKAFLEESKNPEEKDKNKWQVKEFLNDLFFEKKEGKKAAYNIIRNHVNEKFKDENRYNRQIFTDLLFNYLKDNRSRYYRLLSEQFKKGNNNFGQFNLVEVEIFDFKKGLGNLTDPEEINEAEIFDYVQFIKFKDRKGSGAHPIDKVLTDIRDKLSKSSSLLSIMEQYLSTATEASEAIRDIAQGKRSEDKSSGKTKAILAKMANAISSTGEQVSNQINDAMDYVFKTTKAANDVMARQTELKIEQAYRIAFDKDNASQSDFGQYFGNLLYSGGMDVINAATKFPDIKRSLFSINLYYFKSKIDADNAKAFLSWMNVYNERLSLVDPEQQVIKGMEANRPILKVNRNQDFQKISTAGGDYLAFSPLYSRSENGFNYPIGKNVLNMEDINSISKTPYYQSLDDFIGPFQQGLINPTARIKTQLQGLATEFESKKSTIQEKRNIITTHDPGREGPTWEWIDAITNSTLFNDVSPNPLDFNDKEYKQHIGNDDLKYFLPQITNQKIGDKEFLNKDSHNKSVMFYPRFDGEITSPAANFIDQIMDLISRPLKGGFSFLEAPMLGSLTTRTSPFLDNNSRWGLELRGKILKYERFLTMFVSGLKLIFQNQSALVASLVDAAGGRASQDENTTLDHLSNRIDKEFELMKVCTDKMIQHFDEYVQTTNSYLDAWMQYDLLKYEAGTNLSQLIGNLLVKVSAAGLILGVGAWKPTWFAENLKYEDDISEFIDESLLSLLDASVLGNIASAYYNYYRYQYPNLIQYAPLLNKNSIFKNQLLFNRERKSTSTTEMPQHYAALFNTPSKSSIARENVNASKFLGMREDGDMVLENAMFNQNQSGFENSQNGSYDGELLNFYYYLDEQRLKMRQQFFGRIETDSNNSGLQTYAGQKDQNYGLLKLRMPMFIKDNFPKDLSDTDEYADTARLLQDGAGNFVKNYNLEALMLQPVLNAQQNLRMLVSLWQDFIALQSQIAEQAVRLFALTSSRKNLRFLSSQEVRKWSDKAFDSLMSYEQSLFDLFSADIEKFKDAMNNNVKKSQELIEKYNDLETSTARLGRRIIGFFPTVIGAAYTSAKLFEVANKTHVYLDNLDNLAAYSKEPLNPFSSLNADYAIETRVQQRQGLANIFQTNLGFSSANNFDKNPALGNQAYFMNGFVSPQDYENRVDLVLPSYAYRTLDREGKGNDPHYSGGNLNQLFGAQTGTRPESWSDNPQNEHLMRFANTVHYQSLSLLRNYMYAGNQSNDAQDNNVFNNKFTSQNVFLHQMHGLSEASAELGRDDRPISEMDQGPFKGSYIRQNHISYSNPNMRFLDVNGKVVTATNANGLPSQIDSPLNIETDSAETETETQGGLVKDRYKNSFVNRFYSANTYDFMAAMDLDQKGTDYQIERMKTFKLFNIYTQAIENAIDQILKVLSTREYNIESVNKSTLMRRLMSILQLYNSTQDQLREMATQELLAQIETQNRFNQAQLQFSIEKIVDYFFFTKALAGFLRKRKPSANSSTLPDESDELTEAVSSRYQDEIKKTIEKDNAKRLFIQAGLKSSLGLFLMLDKKYRDDLNLGFIESIFRDSDENKKIDESTQNNPQSKEAEGENQTTLTSLLQKQDTKANQENNSNLKGFESKINNTSKQDLNSIRGQSMHSSVMGGSFINRAGLQRENIRLRRQQKRSEAMMMVFEQIMSNLNDASDVTGSGSGLSSGEMASIAKQGVAAVQALNLKKFERLKSQVEEDKKINDEVRNLVRQSLVTGIFRAFKLGGVLGAKAFKRFKKNKHVASFTRKLGSRGLNRGLGQISKSSGARKVSSFARPVTSTLKLIPNSNIGKLLVARVVTSGFDSNPLASQDGENQPVNIESGGAGFEGLENLMYQAELAQAMTQIQKDIYQQEFKELYDKFKIKEMVQRLIQNASFVARDEFKDIKKRLRDGSNNNEIKEAEWTEKKALEYKKRGNNAGFALMMTLSSLKIDDPLAFILSSGRKGTRGIKNAKQGLRDLESKNITEEQLSDKQSKINEQLNSITMPSQGSTNEEENLSWYEKLEELQERTGESVFNLFQKVPSSNSSNVQSLKKGLLKGAAMLDFLANAGDVDEYGQSRFQGKNKQFMDDMFTKAGKYMTKSNDLAEARSELKRGQIKEGDMLSPNMVLKTRFEDDATSGSNSDAAEVAPSASAETPPGYTPPPPSPGDASPPPSASAETPPGYTPPPPAAGQPQTALADAASTPSPGQTQGLPGSLEKFTNDEKQLFRSFLLRGDDNGKNNLDLFDTNMGKEGVQVSRKFDDKVFKVILEMGIEGFGAQGKSLFESLKKQGLIDEQGHAVSMSNQRRDGAIRQALKSLSLDSGHPNFNKLSRLINQTLTPQGMGQESQAVAIFLASRHETIGGNEMSASKRVAGFRDAIKGDMETEHYGLQRLLRKNGNLILRQKQLNRSKQIREKKFQSDAQIMVNRSRYGQENIDFSQTAFKDTMKKINKASSGSLPTPLEGQTTDLTDLSQMYNHVKNFIDSDNFKNSDDDDLKDKSVLLIQSLALILDNQGKSLTGSPSTGGEAGAETVPNDPAVADPVPSPPGENKDGGASAQTVPNDSTDPDLTSPSPTENAGGGTGTERGDSLPQSLSSQSTIIQDTLKLLKNKNIPADFIQSNAQLLSNRNMSDEARSKLEAGVDLTKSQSVSTLPALFFGAANLIDVGRAVKSLFSSERGASKSDTQLQNITAAFNEIEKGSNKGVSTNERIEALKVMGSQRKSKLDTATSEGYNFRELADDLNEQLNKATVSLAQPSQGENTQAVSLDQESSDLRQVKRNFVAMLELAVTQSSDEATTLKKMKLLQQAVQNLEDNNRNVLMGLLETRDDVGRLLREESLKALRIIFDEELSTESPSAEGNEDSPVLPSSLDNMKQAIEEFLQNDRKKILDEGVYKQSDLLRDLQARQLQQQQELKKELGEEKTAEILGKMKQADENGEDYVVEFGRVSAHVSNKVEISFKKKSQAAQGTQEAQGINGVDPIEIDLDKIVAVYSYVKTAPSSGKKREIEDSSGFLGAKGFKLSDYREESKENDATDEEADLLKEEAWNLALSEEREAPVERDLSLFMTLLEAQTPRQNDRAWLACYNAELERLSTGRQLPKQLQQLKHLKSLQSKKECSPLSQNLIRKVYQENLKNAFVNQVEALYGLGCWDKNPSHLKRYLWTILPFKDLERLCQKDSAAHILNELMAQEEDSQNQKRSLEALRRFIVVNKDILLIKEAILNCLERQALQDQKRQLWSLCIQAFAKRLEEEKDLSPTRIHLAKLHYNAFFQDKLGAELKQQIAQKLEAKPALQKHWLTSKYWTQALAAMSPAQASYFCKMMPHSDALQVFYQEIKKQNQLKKTFDHFHLLIKDEAAQQQIWQRLVKNERQLQAIFDHHLRMSLQLLILSKKEAQKQALLPFIKTSPFKNVLEKVFDHSRDIETLCLDTESSVWTKYFLQHNHDNAGLILWTLWVIQNKAFESYFSSMNNKIYARHFQGLQTRQKHNISLASTKKLHRALREKGFINANFQASYASYQGMLFDNKDFQDIVDRFGIDYEKMAQFFAVLRDKESLWGFRFNKYQAKKWQRLPSFSKYQQTLKNIIDLWQKRPLILLENMSQTLWRCKNSTVSFAEFEKEFKKVARKSWQELHPLKIEFYLHITQNLEDEKTQNTSEKLFLLFEALYHKGSLKRSTQELCNEIFMNLSEINLRLALQKRKEQEKVSRLFSYLEKDNAMRLQPRLANLYCRMTAIDKNQLIHSYCQTQNKNLSQALKAFCVFEDRFKNNVFCPIKAADLVQSDSQLLLAMSEKSPGCIDGHQLLKNIERYLQHQPEGGLNVALILNQAHLFFKEQDWLLIPSLLKLDLEELSAFAVLLEPQSRQCFTQFINKVFDVNMTQKVEEILQDLYQFKNKNNDPILAVLSQLKFSGQNIQEDSFKQQLQRIKAHEMRLLLNALVQDQALLALFTKQVCRQPEIVQGLFQKIAIEKIGLNEKTWALLLKVPQFANELNIYQLHHKEVFAQQVFIQALLHQRYHPSLSKQAQAYSGCRVQEKIMSKENKKTNTESNLLEFLNHLEGKSELEKQQLWAQRCQQHVVNDADFSCIATLLDNTSEESIRYLKQLMTLRSYSSENALEVCLRLSKDSAYHLTDKLESFLLKQKTFYPAITESLAFSLEQHKRAQFKFKMKKKWGSGVQTRKKASSVKRKYIKHG